MMLRFKKLAILLVFVLLMMWSITFIKYFHTQPFLVDENHVIKISDREKLGSQQLGAGGESRNYDAKMLGLVKSKLLRVNQTQKQQMVNLQAPSVVLETDLKNMESDVAQDLISRIKVDCRDHICSEFVTKADKPHFDYCIRKTWGLSRARYREPGESVCRFINGTGRNPIALASFPGSGNTWVRGLIQGVTGLCTGAIYCDRTLRKTGFPGESIRSGIALVVKTHHEDPRWTGIYYDKSAPFSYFKEVEHIPVYTSAIFLLRNPFDSLVSEYSRQLRQEQPDNHINIPRREYFGK